MITLKNLGQATSQEVFTQIKEHLLKQNKRAATDKNDCMYKTKDGLKCAAGCLIADDEYSPRFEHLTWFSLIRDYNYSDKHVHLIGNLQDIHDIYAPDQWPVMLAALAQDFNLTY